MSIKALSDYTVYAKYARYKKDLKRRETWVEQVGRMFSMHREKYATQIANNPTLKALIDFAEQSQLQKLVLGSQRGLQFGGSPILKHESKIFNCSFGHLSRNEAFQEAMYLLLCGCGVGFSVQKHHIAQLSNVTPRTNGKKTFKPEDTIEGWADCIGVLLSSYFTDNQPFPEYAGYDVEFDFSNIRPEGAFISGGFKAPGPNGLKKSLEKIKILIEDRFKQESWTRESEFTRKLRPIDAYDILMHASDAVLSGGVRRSATICLFSLSDVEMIRAKTGKWHITNPQRGRSNNSVVLLRDKIDKKQFDAIKESVRQFGEPGFVFVEDIECGVNPCCVTSENNILTDKGYKKVKDLVGKRFNTIIDGDKYESTDDGFFSSGYKPVYVLSTKEGVSLQVTQDHLVLTQHGWKEAQDLKDGDKIILSENISNKWDGDGNYQQGWLVGNLIGDGCFNQDSALLDYWNDNRFEMLDVAISFLNKNNFKTYHEFKGGSQTSSVGKVRVGSVKLKEYALCLMDLDKNIDDRIYNYSSDFIAGLVSGIFDADGSVQGNHIKGASIRLSSVKLNNLYYIQKLLLGLGIKSVIYRDRLPEGLRNMPDGKGGLKEYFCKATHELVISNESILKFSSLIRFQDAVKQASLENLISSYKRLPNKDKFEYSFESFVYSHEDEVYDCTIPKKGAFNSDGAILHNCEIGFRPITEDGRHGFQFCNLTTINGRKCNNEDTFMEACKASAIIGTLQAGYTNFKYLTKESKEITEKESLLGCSITGLMDNPDILLSPALQRKGAREIIKWNKQVAEMIGINQAARTTCIKPEGTSSCVLGSASGIHPHHARRYLRRVQANKLEFPAQVFQKANPLAVEESVWSTNNTDVVLTFLCEVPEGSIVKNKLPALELLEIVKLTQQNWVEAGTNPELGNKDYLRHNVSNTVTVKEDEWDDVFGYIYKNRKYFTGISLLPFSGDKDYPQAPFTTIFTPKELVRLYGDASVFASGLVVDGLAAFNGNLWLACDCVLGVGEEVPENVSKPVEPEEPDRNGYSKDQYISKLKQYILEHDEYLGNMGVYKKSDFVRRAKQFAERYFDDDIKKMTHCLKDVSNWKLWCDLKREYKDIDWSSVIEEDEWYESADTMGAAACSNGACEIQW